MSWRCALAGVGAGAGGSGAALRRRWRRDASTKRPGPRPFREPARRRHPPRRQCAPPKGIAPSVVIPAPISAGMPAGWIAVRSRRTTSSRLQRPELPTRTSPPAGTPRSDDARADVVAGRAGRTPRMRTPTDVCVRPRRPGTLGRRRRQAGGRLQPASGLTKRPRPRPFRGGIAAPGAPPSRPRAVGSRPTAGPRLVSAPAPQRPRQAQAPSPDGSRDGRRRTASPGTRGCAASRSGRTLRTAAPR